MSPSSANRRRKAMQVFLEAAELAPADRGPFLERTLADDPDLRHMVEQMLAYDTMAPRTAPPDGRAGDTPRILSEVLKWLARRHAQPSRLEPERPDAPRYRLDGEIARGGMGAILKVWDEDLRRTLAMKVILGGGDQTADGGGDGVRLNRFLDEARITGQLDHPGVVPVHELGVDPTGRVYFTMRLLRGRDFATIIQLARSGHQEWTRTRALDALLRVCETMAFAHQKGVAMAPCVCGIPLPGVPPRC
jgi:hypothetical protein